MTIIVPSSHPSAPETNSAKTTNYQNNGGLNALVHILAMQHSVSSDQWVIDHIPEPAKVKFVECFKAEAGIKNGIEWKEISNIFKSIKSPKHREIVFGPVLRRFSTKGKDVAGVWQTFSTEEVSAVASQFGIKVVAEEQKHKAEHEQITLVLLNNYSGKNCTFFMAQVEAKKHNKSYEGGYGWDYNRDSENFYKYVKNALNPLNPKPEEKDINKIIAGFEENRSPKPSPNIGLPLPGNNDPNGKILGLTSTEWGTWFKQFGEFLKQCLEFFKIFIEGINKEVKPIYDECVDACKKFQGGDNQAPSDDSGSKPGSDPKAPSPDAAPFMVPPQAPVPPQVLPQMQARQVPQYDPNPVSNTFLPGWLASPVPPVIETEENSEEFALRSRLWKLHHN